MPAAQLGEGVALGEPERRVEEAEGVAEAVVDGVCVGEFETDELLLDRDDPENMDETDGWAEAVPHGLPLGRDDVDPTRLPLGQADAKASALVVDAVPVGVLLGVGVKLGELLAVLLDEETHAVTDAVKAMPPKT